MRTIRYGIDLDTGLVISRVENQAAVPILDYSAITPENDFAVGYYLEKMSVFELRRHTIKWTRKIPKRIKNKHRKFWGFEELI